MIIKELEIKNKEICVVKIIYEKNDKIVILEIFYKTFF